jgi:PhzF family phenazine biosynthesis protein
MSVKIPMFQVDAFTDEMFAGNPAAVCLLEGWLPDTTLQSIAAENNLSETAFLVRRGDGFELRWMTPIAEVELCGHATLAAGLIVLGEIDPGRAEVRFETRAAGTLTVARSGDRLLMHLPVREPDRIPEPAGLAAALGREPVEVWQRGKLMAVLASEAEVAALDPDLAWIERHDSDGLIVTAPGDEHDFVSRYFAPHLGIPEDPVTGSAHCLLAPYWIERLRREPLRGRQISARGGEIEVRLAGDQIAITAGAVVYLRGEIVL